MEQAAIIPVVKWIRNGYASEFPTQMELPTENRKNKKKTDLMDLEDYDHEDSKSN